MFVSLLPFLLKVLSYLFLLSVGFYAFVEGFYIVGVLVALSFLVLLWLDWSDWKLKRFFSYDFYFRKKNYTGGSIDEAIDDLELVEKEGRRLRELLHQYEEEGLSKLGIKATIKQKSDLVVLYKDIESQLERLNKFFWKYNGKTNLKLEEGKVAYFVYISAFIYLYEAGVRLSESSLLVVTLLSDKSETFKNLMRSLVFPSTQIFVESGTYVLSKLKFNDAEVRETKKVFINEVKNYMDVRRFPVLSSFKYYLSLLKLFRNQRVLPYFKRFLVRLSHTKIREGDMAMSLDDVDKVLEVLEPGDIIIVRRASTMTAVVIPGYWTHVAMYVGSKAEVEKYFGVDSDDVLRRFEDLGLEDKERYVFEAVEKGVSASGYVKGVQADSIIVFKPKVGEFDRLRAVEFVLEHLNKEYDYGLDFFSEGAFVCSELVYKAYSDAETGEHRLGFEAKFKGGLVYTFSPQDMYESCMTQIGDRFEIGICMKHSGDYSRVYKSDL